MIALYIIFSLILFSYVHCYSDYYVSPIDRDVNIMKCIKFTNSCSKYDAMEIREICLLISKRINYFPQQASSNDIINICSFMFEKEGKNFFKLYGDSINTYNNLYGNNIIEIMTDKNKFSKLING